MVNKRIWQKLATKVANFCHVGWSRPKISIFSIFQKIELEISENFELDFSDFQNLRPVWIF